MQTQNVQGNRHPSQDSITEFIDKCTARWLFEKTGVRLYEVVLQKCPSELHSRFAQILKEEKQHEEMLEDVIRRYGADPHAMTPSARITKIESEGIVNVVEHENYKAIVEALLAAELVDNANWELLVKMAHKLGDLDARDKFASALDEEETHLEFLRDNLTNTLLNAVSH